MTLAFVAGATGYTGREVVGSLASREVQTHAHVRHDSPSLDSWRKRFEPMGVTVDSTPWDLDDLVDSFEQLRPSHVFALLGTTRARRSRNTGSAVADTYEAVDYGLTSLMIQAALRAGSVERFVYLSALGVREGTSNPYYAARARVESELRATDLPWTIVRASLITGPDRDEVRIMERAGSVIGGGVLAVAGALGARGLRDRFRPMTGAELGSAMVRCGFDPACENRILTPDKLC